MKQRKLYLEQRIALVRRLLNCETVRFGDQLPKRERQEFHHLMLDCITILDAGVDENRRDGKDGSEK